jgi:multiple sugar transport system substrate-binding protein
MSDHRLRRREFIQSTGLTAGIAATARCIGGGGGSGGGGGGGGGGTSQPPGENVEAASKIQFISESTPPSQALRSIVGRFTERTGIEVEFTLTPLLNYTEKLSSDLTSQAGNYDAVYVDPYNIGAPYYPDLEPLDGYIKQNDYDMDDHIDIHISACSQYGGENTSRALPYDCPTILLAYRGDVFDEYGEQASSDLGFQAEPSPDMTWSQYAEIARWINENVPDDVVPYGTGHMAKQHQSLANEFEMLQWAFGGTQLEGFDGKSPQIPEDPAPQFTSDASVEAAKFYTTLVDEIAHPASTTWDWSGVAQAFANGKIAMAPEWHEFNGLFSDPESSQVVDAVRWTLAPSGPAKNRNVQAHYGGSGIGINKYASDAKRKAAWQFIEWTTSPDIQFELLKAAGGTPTRRSVYERDPVAQAIDQPTAESEFPNVVPPVLEGWKDENIGQRPHHADWLQLEQVIYTEGSKMVNANKSPQAAMESINNGFGNVL